ncbi:MAG: XRE family transcriptional regulator [Bdellovibrionaceae bacterium]|jgi:predicted XRE-type DNA-binding protein|nr:XRE family transcriptional regulator [Pseudobdellovibrionaceae bacterium]
MAFPSQKEVERIRKKLAKVEPTMPMPKNATKAEKLKYELCRQFVKYLVKTKLSQKELAEEIDIPPARLNEIVKYKIDLFTVDRLIDYAERLRPNLKITLG